MIASRPRLFGTLGATAAVATALLANAVGSMTIFDATVERAGDPPIVIDCPAIVKPVVPHLEVLDLVVGAGAAPEVGQTIVVSYTGWLWVNRATGPKFDSTADHGGSMRLPFGKGVTIKGWEQGLVGMRVGGTRTLIIPPALGYGERGAGGVVPPNATLRFDVQLLAIE